MYIFVAFNLLCSRKYLDFFRLFLIVFMHRGECVVGQCGLSRILLVNYTFPSPQFRFAIAYPEF